MTVIVCLLVGCDLHAQSPNGNATIRAMAGKSEIIIRTTQRVAGAVHSLTWNGMEMIDSTDHGRQLQSASNFNSGKRFIPETFNPTEAGSRRDGAGRNSTSRLLKFTAKGSTLTSTTQMAFWLRPGEKSQGHPARNQQPLSNHLLTKRIRIGYKNLPHVIDYQVTFTVPKGERHTYAQFEALTGYMPKAFDTFLKYDPQKKKLIPLSDGPGEQRHPVVLSTRNGSHAMGVFSPDQPSKGYESAGYGRFRFNAEKVNKWNCVFRAKSPKGIRAGKYTFQIFVIVGDRKDVERAMEALICTGK